MTGQDRTGQHRTGQDRTGQDRTQHDTTRHDKTSHKEMSPLLLRSAYAKEVETQLLVAMAFADAGGGSSSWNPSKMIDASGHGPIHVLIHSVRVIGWTWDAGLQACSRPGLSEIHILGQHFRTAILDASGSTCVTC